MRVLLGAVLVIATTTLPAQQPGAPARTTPPAVVTDTGPRQPVRETTECVVTRVIDGDTIECRTIGRVRLIGIDAPERTQKPFDAAPTAALQSLLPGGTRARLEPDVEARDQYGRTLGYVWVNGRMVNWLMVRSGWAVLLTIPPDVQHVDAFRSAERLARTDSLGLWRVGGFDCTPADHRRNRC